MFSGQGCIEQPRYMDTNVLYHTRVVIGQLRFSSYNVEIESNLPARVSEWTCELCHLEVDSEEHCACRCTGYGDTEDRYDSVLSQ
mgnify:FL=1